MGRFFSPPVDGPPWPGLMLTWALLLTFLNVAKMLDKETKPVLGEMWLQIIVMAKTSCWNTRLHGLLSRDKSTECGEKNHCKDELKSRLGLECLVWMCVWLLWSRIDSSSRRRKQMKSALSCPQQPKSFISHLKSIQQPTPLRVKRPRLENRGGRGSWSGESTPVLISITAISVWGWPVSWCGW